MTGIRMDWNKISRARRRIRSGFYDDPQVRSAVVDRCVESIVDEATFEVEGAPGAPDHDRHTLPVTR
jgi:hypothetical protein